jgi:hypothetical protein
MALQRDFNTATITKLRCELENLYSYNGHQLENLYSYSGHQDIRNQIKLQVNKLLSILRTCAGFNYRELTYSNYTSITSLQEILAFQKKYLDSYKSFTPCVNELLSIFSGEEDWIRSALSKEVKESESIMQRVTSTTSTLVSHTTTEFDKKKLVDERIGFLCEAMARNRKLQSMLKYELHVFPHAKPFVALHDIAVTKEIICELKGREIDREAGMSLTTLKKRLPNDILTHIGGFLPYHIQFNLLEKRYNLPGILKKIHKCIPLTTNLYRKLVQKPSISRGFIKPATSVLISEKQMLTLIYRMKKICPNEVMMLLKELAILINPKPKHRYTVWKPQVV